MWDEHRTRAPLSKKGSCQRQLTEGIDAESRGEKDRVGRIRKATNLSDKIANTSPKCRKERTSYRLIPSGLRPAPLLCKGSSIRQYPGATVLCPFASMFLHFKSQFIVPEHREKRLPTRGSRLVFRGTDQARIARSLANSVPLAWAKSFRRSSTVSFCLASPSTSTMILPSCIMISRLPWAMASRML